MKKKTEEVHGALDLSEEGVHLIRRAPLRLLLQYYVGSFPFVIGFLYFWADMSRGAFAHRHISEAALGVSVLYIWMKCWQSVYCLNLYSRLSTQQEQTFPLKRILRIIATQMILQPYGVFLIPFSILIVLPFAWTFGFFQNVLVIGDGNDLNLRRIIRTSWRLASLWAAQNHRMLLIVTVFTFVVFINVGVLLLFLPQLLKMLFGIETIFTLSGFHVLNTTFLSVVVAITYLCVDPLIATVYTLRCFYGESIGSGADLVAELNGLAEAS
jgi:hypothetical protein